MKVRILKWWQDHAISKIQETLEIAAFMCFILWVFMSMFLLAPMADFWDYYIPVSLVMFGIVGYLYFKLAQSKIRQKRLLRNARAGWLKYKVDVRKCNFKHQNFEQSYTSYEQLGPVVEGRVHVEKFHRATMTYKHTFENGKTRMFSSNGAMLEVPNLTYFTADSERRIYLYINPERPKQYFFGF